MIRRHAVSAGILLVLAFSWTAGVPNARADDPIDRTLRLHPAAVPVPALEYRLLAGPLGREPGNAAPLYGTAVLLLAGDERCKEVNRVFSGWLDTPLEALPLDEVRRALDGKIGSALHYVELAARRQRCEWDPPLEEGAAMAMPELGHLRDLGRLEALKARLAIAEGRNDDALAALRTGMEMARQVAQGPTLIHGLVGIAMANITRGQVEELVQARGAPNLYWALTMLPRPPIDLRNALEREVENLSLFVAPELLDIDAVARSPEQWRALLWKVYTQASLYLDGSAAFGAELPRVVGAMKHYGQSRDYLLSRGRSAEQVDAMPVAEVIVRALVGQYLEAAHENAKVAYLPCWQMDAAVTRELRLGQDMWKQPPGLALAAAVMPAARRASLTAAMLQRRVDILRCAEAVRAYAAAHEGRLPASLSDVTEVPIPLDPVTGQAFEYELTGDRAVLVAPVPFGGRPADAIRYELTIVK